MSELVKRLRGHAVRESNELEDDLYEAASRIEALEAENARLMADAKRYRFLRDEPWPPELEADIVLRRNARWDAAIDAALKDYQ